MAIPRQYVRFVLAAALAVLCVVGFLPATAAAEQARERRSDIVIRTNAEFDAAHGVRSGSGTAEDPYVISGWELNNLTIKDTSAHVVITDNTITRRLTLDWIDSGVHVHGNDVGDLRVNQNVPRTGQPTSGVIADNVFGVVGQLRHFDGVFEENIVGEPQVSEVDKALSEVVYSRAVNFDGFNGARFRNNVIYGYTEVRLHGHHHSSGFGEESHHHGGTGHDVDHTERYHEVWITGNKIVVPAGSYKALEYVDNNHAGNDRTAASETNPALNDPHVHYTRVHITDNELIGAGLSVNIFNAEDERHKAYGRGRVNIDRNTIRLAKPLSPFRVSDGITVQDARDLDLFIRDNVIEGIHAHGAVEEWLYYGRGIDLYDVRSASVRVYDNNVSHFTYGLSASYLSESRWFVGGLVTDHVEQDVYLGYQASPPEERAADPDPDEEYENEEDGTEPPPHDH